MCEIATKYEILLPAIRILLSQNKILLEISDFHRNIFICQQKDCLGNQLALLINLKRFLLTYFFHLNLHYFKFKTSMENNTRISSSAFASKFQSKAEIYRFFTQEVKAYLPAYQQVTIFHLKDIACGNKRVSAICYN